MRKLTADEAKKCDDIARHRLKIGSTPEGSRLRVRRASMGGSAGRDMFRLIVDRKVQRIFEIGTCVGIGAAYMCAAAETHGPVSYVGMEGIPEKQALAESTLEQFCPNTSVQIFYGHFDNSFEPALEAASPLEFVYLDGRHKYDPTLYMFTKCADQMQKDGGGLIVCDDLSMPALRKLRTELRDNAFVKMSFQVNNKHAFQIE